MASLRASTPSNGGSSSPSSPYLSPRSKLNALIAAAESDSDDESGAPGKQQQENSVPKSASRRSPTGLSETDDDEDDIVRPRGKFASRMRVQTAGEAASGSKSAADARERVRRMLTAAKDTTKDAEATSAKDVDMEGGHKQDDSDEEVVPTRPRARKLQAGRSKTPERSAAAGPDSSPLFVSDDLERADESPASPLKTRTLVASNDGDASADSDSDVGASDNILKNPRFQALVAKKRQERLAREAEEARKRAARQEAAAATSSSQVAGLSEDDDDVSNISDDDGGRRLTQDVAKRPAARKASKKALEDMNRETQRLTRSLQLAHEAKTRKKVTKATLFERFNFKPEVSVAAAVASAVAEHEEEQHNKLSSSSRPGTPVSVQHTDAEMRDAETPPSSPPVPGKEDGVPKAVGSVAPLSATATGSTAPTESVSELPTVQETAEHAQAQTTLDKGKAAAKTKRNFRVKLPMPPPTSTLRVNVATLNSDDDELDIQMPRNTKLDAMFDRVPANQVGAARPMHALRRLAQLDDPDRKPAPPDSRQARRFHKTTASANATVMTPAELAASLQQRAREQARAERDRRVELLRSKGVHVPTAEEREREMAQVEDIVSRARAEAEEIMLREREAAKEARRVARQEGGEAADPLAWDDSDDDGSWDGNRDEEVEMGEVELSGSEGDEEHEEDGDEDDAESETEDAVIGGGLLDDAAESGDDSADEEAEDGFKAADSDDDDEAAPARPVARRSIKKHVTILSDDEDEEVTPNAQLVEATPRPKLAFPKSPSAPNSDSPKVPTSVLRSATKPFIPGLPVAGPAGLGLTQIFAGTMDDSQAGSALAASPSQPMPTFEQFPDSQFSQNIDENPDEEPLIQNSQAAAGEETQNGETQMVRITLSESQLVDATQGSELIEATQDGGFQDKTPLRQRFVEVAMPASTIETVAIEASQAEVLVQDSPLLRRPGRLRRKNEEAAAAPAPSAPILSDDDEDVQMDDGIEDEDEFGFGTTTNAFAAMKEGAKQEKKAKAIDAFNKKKSKAKEMFEEQAEESEDEYAGLGGVDGEDDSDNEDAASVKEMIDDETKSTEVDDRKLAAFFADRERATDEKQVEKLFRDITSGMMRRKRGADYDLSDSDDGGEARRRLKRRQFAKMQKALFADERISKVAENPRNSAFLRTIEDRGSDDEMDFLFEQPQPAAAAASASTVPSGSQVAIPDSQPSNTAAPKASTPAVANPRRTAAGASRKGKKPASLGEIRESLSNLLEEPNAASSIIPATDDGFDSDDENNAADNEEDALPPRSSDKENQNPRRGRQVAVVDRITLKRNASSTASNASGRLAFAAAAPAGAASAAGGFRVPALLRRATTNSLMSNSSATSSSTASTAAGASHNNGNGGNSSHNNGGGFGDEAKIRRNAGKRSGINYFARETERRAAVAESEKRREAKKMRGAEGRGRAVGGLFAAGKFE